ncbi:MAG: phasin family protein [Burkholderiaceae bacterium]
MVKKLKALAKTDDRQLAEAVRTSAQQIWQAGLGAFAKAQEEGGKVFAKLVKEGTELQQRTQKLAGSKVAGVTDTVTKMADNVSKQASGSWDKLEQVFEDRVSRSLTSLGVPTQNDIQTLTRRVEELSKAVAALSGKKVPAKTAARSAKPTVKAAAKTAAKPVAKKAVAKPAAKPAAKTAKPAAKTAAKPRTKPAAKPVAAQAADSAAS